MKKYLYTISLLTVLCSCHKEDSPYIEDSKAKMTILVYLAAENNLVSYASEDLDEMKTGSLQLAENQNLVVYVNKANSTTSPYLARVKGGELVDTVFVEEGLAADPSVLEKTLKHTIDLFPAESYGLVLWGHASGWLISNSDSISVAQSRAYGGSTGNNSSSGSGRYWMNIPEMATAIGNAVGTEKLRFVLGDCCNFGCVEIAYELRNVTDYVLGSPGEIPDMGAPYHLIIPDLFQENATFYEQVLNHYFDYYLTVYEEHGNVYYNREFDDLKGYSVPLSVLKTSELDQLATATTSILNSISDKISPSGGLNLDNVMYYGVYNGYKYSYDMCHVLKTNASREHYTIWEQAISKAVPYHLHSMKWMTSSYQLMNSMDTFLDASEDSYDVSFFFPNNNNIGTYPDWNGSIRRYQLNNVIRWEQYGW